MLALPGVRGLLGWRSSYKVEVGEAGDESVDKVDCECFSGVMNSFNIWLVWRDIWLEAGSAMTKGINVTTKEDARHNNWSRSDGKGNDHPIMCMPPNPLPMKAHANVMEKKTDGFGLNSVA